MYKIEYEMLNDHSLVTINKLKDKSDRTLLYGYTCERDTWHVYIKDGIIHTAIYKCKESLIERRVNDNFDYVPDKRLYPECCDYEFCTLLNEKGVNLPFTTWQDRKEVNYHEPKGIVASSSNT